ncbi:MAG: O-antigen ligase family protein [Actinobacteria bacterium]|nr:O-antigen ligase family protein [Actinomycetota bacterium]
MGLGRRLQGAAFPAALMAIVVAMIGIARVGSIPMVLMLGAALAISAVLFLVALKDDRAVFYCALAAGFFSSTQVKAGGLDLAADFLLLGALLLFLKRIGPDREHHIDGERRPAMIGLLLLGLGLIAAGGLIGAIFEPKHTSFVFSIGYQGSALGPLPARFADVVRFAVLTAGIVVVIRAWRPSRRQARAILVAYGAGELLSVAVGVLNGPDADNRVKGLTTHPVFFGLISAAGIIIGYSLVVMRGGRRRLFGVVVTVVSAYGMLISGTRSALLLAAIGVLILQMGLRSLRSASVLATGGIVGIAISLFGTNLAGSTPTITRILGGGYASNSNDARSLLRKETITLVKQHGLTGAGFKYLTPPHNLILGVMAAAGILGLAGLLLVVIALIRQFVATSSGDPVTLAALAVPLSAFACSWVLNAGWDRWMWLPIAVAFATPMKTSTEELPTAKNRHRSSAIAH